MAITLTWIIKTGPSQVYRSITRGKCRHIILKILTASDTDAGNACCRQTDIFHNVRYDIHLRLSDDVTFLRCESSSAAAHRNLKPAGLSSWCRTDISKIMPGSFFTSRSNSLSRRIHSDEEVAWKKWYSLWFIEMEWARSKRRWGYHRYAAWWCVIDMDQRWLNADSTSAAMAKHWNNAGL